MIEKNEHTPFPHHVAIIMDGNGRWAKNKGQLRIFGHKNGVQAVRRAVMYASKNNVHVLTLYAFSRENWCRPKHEVTALMNLFIHTLEVEVEKLHKNNIKLNIIGDISRFTPKLQHRIQTAQQLTQHNQGLILNIAANYGGYWDIVQASQKLARQVKECVIDPHDINEERFQQALVTHELPPVDLLIRTSGEQRISNFLLWQIAYAEFYFCDVLWPDFNETHFKQAILAFQQRDRRFGASQ